MSEKKLPEMSLGLRDDKVGHALSSVEALLEAEGSQSRS